MMVEARRKFFENLRDALDGLPEKKLARKGLSDGKSVCAMGAMMCMAGFTPPDFNAIRAAHALWSFDIDMTGEVIRQNDMNADETPKERWIRMRDWASAQIEEVSP